MITWLSINVILTFCLKTRTKFIYTSSWSIELSLSDPHPSHWSAKITLCEPSEQLLPPTRRKMIFRNREQTFMKMETTCLKNLTRYQFHKRLFPIFETFFFSPCRVISAPVSGNINDNVSPSLPVVCVHLKYLHSGKTLKYFPCGSKVHSLFFFFLLSLPAISIHWFEPHSFTGRGSKETVGGWFCCT